MDKLPKEDCGCKEDSGSGFSLLRKQATAYLDFSSKGITEVSKRKEEIIEGLYKNLSMERETVEYLLETMVSKNIPKMFLAKGIRSDIYRTFNPVLKNTKIPITIENS